MRFMFPSRLIGTVTAAAMALTTIAAVPAHADDQRNARIAATILGLAVIGAIVNDHKKDKREERKVYRAPVQQKKVYKERRREVVRHRGAVQPRPLPRRVDRKLLPQNCLRSFETRQGRAHMFGRHCLERHYRSVHRLPRNCAMTIRTYQGKRSGYDARCLRRSGYRLAHG
ncbi:hypothetical protein K3757_17315 [Sulfitobacter sp. S223]|uniref:hypothetical protein n=1 Tax=Sulfitobacter sp. S223 TaxID=2867023 RepID=UPI0021A7611D|nr:hypothetical protein [Sulfitobacter sp. S223]UWR26177.1 hypothetical protein K3757_17315 [Sulfitobacter sp. S223]